jgi:thymidylate synthase (FAD)
MNVRAIAVTAGVIDGITDPEAVIMYCARVSNPHRQFSGDVALLRYCMRKEHVSVFEQADLTVEIETSRAISAQIIRHKSFCFQEFSQRYATVPGFEPVPLHRQDRKNRQNSLHDDAWLQSAPIAGLTNEINAHLDATKKLYDRLLAVDVAREDARMILPMASTTKLYMKGNARSWINYLRTRRRRGETQHAHVDVAEAIIPIFAHYFPVTSEAFGLNKQTTFAKSA